MAQSQQSRKRRAEPEEEEDEESDGDPSTGRQRTSVAVAVQREELLAKFIRYTLFMHTQRRLIKREDYNQNVFADYKRQNLMEDILPLAKQFFASTFGYTLVARQREVRSRSSGGSASFSSQAAPKAVTVYFLVLDKAGSDEDTQRHILALPCPGEHQHQDRALLTTILGLLHYGGGAMAEEVLWHQLSKLGLARGDPKGDFSEPVGELVEAFMKDGYLKKVKDALPGEERVTYTIHPGLRAEAELPYPMAAVHRTLWGPPETNGDANGGGPPPRPAAP